MAFAGAPQAPADPVRTMTRARVLKRLLTIGLAFAAGWMVYMVAMLRSTYDGLPSLLLQPVMAALASGLFVGAALVSGLALKLPVLRAGWNSSAIWAVLIGLAALATLLFGSSLGWTSLATHPDTGEPIRGLHPAAALAGYFSLIFAIVNWPLGSPKPTPRR